MRVVQLYFGQNGQKQEQNPPSAGFKRPLSVAASALPPEPLTDAAKRHKATPFAVRHTSNKYRAQNVAQQQRSQTSKRRSPVRLDHEDEFIENLSAADSFPQSTRQFVRDDEESSDTESDFSEEGSESETIMSLASESDSESTSQRSVSEQDEEEFSVNTSASRSVDTVIYYRTSSAVSSERIAKLKELFQADYPEAQVVVDVQRIKAHFHQRVGLDRLFQSISRGEVREVLVDSSTQICNTKEAFQLFEWVCHTLGTKIQIVPSLQLP